MAKKGPSLDAQKTRAIYKKRYVARPAGIKLS